MQLCEPVSDAQAVADGIRYALKHAQNPPEWIDAQARSGPAAWTYWADALESGEAKRDHHTYNAQLWFECREMAVAFCQEAKVRLPGIETSTFDLVAERYAVVCDKLRALIELHPPREQPDWGPESTFSSAEAAAIVREAAKADVGELDCLHQMADILLKHPRSVAGK